MTDSGKKSSDLRRQHNHDLIRRMRGGDPLNAFDSKASWFPPRPVIKKDQVLVERLYRTADGEDTRTEAALHGAPKAKNVVALTVRSRSDDDSPLGEAS